MNATGFYLHCSGVPRLAVTVTGTGHWLDVIDVADPHDIQLSISIRCDKSRLERAVAAFNAAMQDADIREAAE